MATSHLHQRPPKMMSSGFTVNQARYPPPAVNHPVPCPLPHFQLSITRLSITQFLSQNRKCSRWRPGEEQGAGGAGLSPPGCWVLG